MSGPQHAEAVLVVDDDPQMGRLLSIALAAQGHHALVARSAAEAWRVLCETPVTVMVLDVMMPGESGVQLCRRIREVSDLPIILLTALGSEDERVAGLEAGADDYVVKPFSPRELVLRVKALARRRTGVAMPLTAGLDRSVGSLRLNAGTQQVSRAGRPVHLTPGEFRMLWLLAERPGTTVGWAELLEVLGDGGSPGGGREIVRTAIYRLRGRLGDDPSTPRHVMTDRGRGYRLVADE